MVLPIFDFNVISMAQHQQIVHQDICDSFGRCVQVFGGNFIEVV